MSTTFRAALGYGFVCPDPKCDATFRRRGVAVGDVFACPECDTFVRLKSLDGTYESVGAVPAGTDQNAPDADAVRRHAEGHTVENIAWEGNVVAGEWSIRTTFVDGTMQTFPLVAWIDAYGFARCASDALPYDKDVRASEFAATLLRDVVSVEWTPVEGTP